ncbi:1-deoxy-D-xylulose-5-phosphate synthase [Solemya pervernicosa gill symbiont]|uniref:1-deoxy-D-xylulose-5-phosphate synthase n=2 Tax=Gammaproteobacteria incertae sedis TaxID=118884 RepID=A0A1T2L1E0_9GAMM|nr:1-deoxy-D-xylulose-5-phosphate synthase [Candidatus Reidiella endopervernicosa]OOZ38830.1 1-deoxy-D-xylulose-5-phosphate synthase [Solemya pervernicosa gill symbiont]QKQ27423.1 1-deoxy-D-xylulose-5-phosphate synthase [Candidatus Reidiella endopervernicosa]
MSADSRYPLLETIETPAELRALDDARLPELAEELRAFLIESVSQTGGHLASGLGTVELTIALHYVFNTPEDRLVWDVGHQSYPHKILTGRRKAMPTLRQKGGLAGFPKREESPYDTFGVGHSSTSISAALGMAIAAAQQQSERKVIAVIGDGAMTAGEAFEALNHAGDLDANLLVILNDNDMSISPNVGGMSNYLARLLSGRFYSSVREGSKKVLEHVPPVWEIARRAEEHMKGMVVPGTLFEELGFNYIGPIDGHDMSTLVQTLSNLSSRKGPQFLHIVTRKGKGYTPAEDNPCGYHGVGKFDPDCDTIDNTPGASPSYTEVFGQWLCDMAETSSDLVGITPAMREGSGLVEFSERFPDRYFDVGIAEQHAVTLAAGLACEGIKPVVAIYSTFLQRAYDQLIHDVALQNLPVLFAIDRAGLVGPDGPTHAGSFDLSYLRCIPNMVVMAPSNENECRQMLSTGYRHNGPAAVRYPRGRGPGVTIDSGLEPLPIGKAELVREGKGVAIFCFGTLLEQALVAADQFNATVINMRFVKPLDEEMVLRVSANHQLLVTVEDNAVAGGAGSAVAEALAAHGVERPLLQLGLPDTFVDHGSREELLADCGLDSAGIAHTIEVQLSDATAKISASQQ